MVRLIGADAVGGDQRAVNDDVLALTEVSETFAGDRGRGSQHLKLKP
ncbi:hypothetical protein ACFWIA_12700 [Streptomyces sp. NPDC127068]